MNGAPSPPDPRGEGIFFEALKITDPEKRAAYLYGACAGNQKLRAEVDQLLAHDPGDSSGQDVNVANAFSKPLEIKNGTMIGGRYMVLKRIGSGGCGVVYRGEQQKPIKREVAIKLIQPGMDAEPVLIRFANERQTLANLNHPGIVDIFDAGSFRKCPYFVMEFIEGQNIIEYADSHRFTIQERLEMFLDVCEAVRYAHYNGIIHRDIKPANILVTEKGGKRWPKVIDFGIAKALKDDAGLTQSWQLIGTPAYMSPEQTGLEGATIDERTDIYLLGILLYELLAGCQPFDMRGQTKDECVRIIREMNPEPPSIRSYMMEDETRFQIANCRGAKPFELCVLLSGLDRIVMKCLEKQREQRFATASSLATSIHDYLKELSKRSKRRRRLIFLRIIVLVLVGLCLGLFIALMILTWIEKYGKK